MRLICTRTAKTRANRESGNGAGPRLQAQAGTAEANEGERLLAEGEVDAQAPPWHYDLLHVSHVSSYRWVNEQGGSLRSPRATRPPAGPTLLPSSRSSPASVRAARTAIRRLLSEKEYSWLRRLAPRL
ncbi:hypothetical protein GCM10023100_41980 [Actinocorallia cavernae]|uniref:Uncharacterized protein n=2 Tax=Actinomycetes TaxID=1760 RepID=A0ABP8SSH4_9ACTN